MFELDGCLCGFFYVAQREREKKTSAEGKSVENKDIILGSALCIIKPLALKSCWGQASGEGREYGTQGREAWHMGTSHQLPPSTLLS